MCVLMIGASLWALTAVAVVVRITRRWHKVAMHRWCLMMWWHTMTTVRAIIHIVVALTRLIVVVMQGLLVAMLVLHVVTVRATVIAVVPVATCVLMAVLPRVVVVVEHDA